MTVESLVAELNQEKFEQHLSSGSVRAKSMRKCHKVSSKIRSLALSELLKEKLLRMLTVRFSTRQMVQPLLRFTQPPLEPTRLAMESFKRPARSVLWRKANTMVEINFTIKLLSRPSKLELTTFMAGRTLLQVIKTQVLQFTLTLSKLSLQRVLYNSYEPNRSLIFDEDVELAVSKQKLKIVLSAQYATLAFSSAFSF